MLFLLTYYISDGKGSACNAGDLGPFLGGGNPLKKGMATPSYILAWQIPRKDCAWSSKDWT